MPIQDKWFRGISPAWRTVEELAAKYGPTAHEVLLVGPTGSGKTLVAELLHHHSRRPGQLVTCSLQRLPDSIAHGLLVGHRRGAFTNATRDSRGYMEQAHGGSLFLDELHRASPLVQNLLVDLGDRKPIRRIGEERDTPLDVKPIYGTSAEPDELASRYDFAEDLMHRIGCLHIRVPALRERQEDILPMAHHLLAGSLGQERKPFRARMTPQLERLLREYPWPGNARELANVCVAIAISLDVDRAANVADLPGMFVSGAGPGQQPLSEKERFEAALRRSGGNVAKAARLLSVPRSRFYRRRSAG